MSLARNCLLRCLPPPPPVYALIALHEEVRDRDPQWRGAMDKWPVHTCNANGTCGVDPCGEAGRRCAVQQMAQTGHGSGRAPGHRLSMHATQQRTVRHPEALGTRIHFLLWTAVPCEKPYYAVLTPPIAYSRLAPTQPLVQYCTSSHALPVADVMHSLTHRHGVGQPQLGGRRVSVPGGLLVPQTPNRCVWKRRLLGCPAPRVLATFPGKGLTGLWARDKSVTGAGRTNARAPQERLTKTQPIHMVITCVASPCHSGTGNPASPGWSPTCTCPSATSQGPCPGASTARLTANATPAEVLIAQL